MDEAFIIAEVKKKKELKSVSEDFVRKVLLSEMKKNPFPDKLSDKQLKLVVKTIRAKLRLSVGRFSGTNNSGIHDAHISTRERMLHYTWLKSKISQMGVKSVLDLGCGLNPLFLATPGLVYYACDINESNISEVKKFFDKNEIKGKAFVADVNNLPDLPSFDLVLSLKLFDIIDVKGRKNVENLISNLKYRKFIASFPTIKISGRRMSRPRRIWFEKMLYRLGHNPEIKETDNEIFYIFTQTKD